MNYYILSTFTKVVVTIKLARFMANDDMQRTCKS